VKYYSTTKTEKVTRALAVLDLWCLCFPEVELPTDGWWTGL